MVQLQPHRKYIDCCQEVERQQTQHGRWPEGSFHYTYTAPQTDPLSSTLQWCTLSDVTRPKQVLSAFVLKTRF